MLNLLLPLGKAALSVAGTTWAVDEGLNLLDRTGVDATGERGRAKKTIEARANAAALANIGRSGEYSEQEVIAQLIEDTRRSSLGQAPRGQMDPTDAFLSEILASESSRLHEIAQTTGQMTFTALAQRAGVGGF